MSTWSDIRLQFVYCEMGKIARKLRKAFLSEDVDAALQEFQNDCPEEGDDFGDDPDN